MTAHTHSHTHTHTHTHRGVDRDMHQLACKHTPPPTHTLTRSQCDGECINNWSIIFGRLFNGLCFLSVFKSRNHCSHFHIKIPPPRDTLSCGWLVAWLTSECAHPHKRKSIHKHPLMSPSPLAETLACVHVHTHSLKHTHKCTWAHSNTIVPGCNKSVDGGGSLGRFFRAGSGFRPSRTLRETS